MNRNERRKIAKQKQAPAATQSGQSSEKIAALFEEAQAHFDRGQAQEAFNTCQEILIANPREPDALHLAGVIAYLSGQPEKAVEFLKRATKARKDFAEAYYNLGLSLNKLKRVGPAETAYRRAIKIAPNEVSYYNNLGNLLTAQAKHNEAIAVYEAALNIQSDHPQILNNFGATLASLGRYEDAITAHLEAISVQPDFADAYNNLGNAYLAKGDLTSAIANFNQAILAEPEHARAFNNLGNALLDAGEPYEAAKAYQKSLAIEPNQARTLSNLIYCYQYTNALSAEVLAQHHHQWEEKFGSASEKMDPTPSGKSHKARNLRLGFVSADLGKHPVGYFLIGLLENLKTTHPNSHLDIFCYSDRKEIDGIGERLKQASLKWVTSFGFSDDQLTRKINADKIDILFELSGHTRSNRLTLFAQKPAPLQISWGIGYPGSTGLSAIDILLTDAHHIRPDEDKNFNETIIRMPNGVSVYEPPSYAPDIGPQPFDLSGKITFGALTQSRKINADVLATWAAILKKVPNSRLLLKYTGIDDLKSVERITETLLQHDVDADCLLLEGGAPHAEFLERYNSVDIGLDTFPYSGGITTCEALWMGVPVVTFPGPTVASRHATSHLATVGLTEMITKNISDYINKAIELAQDIDHLRSLRSSLREKIASSPLCDGPRYALDFETLIHEIWQRHHKK